MRGPGAAGAVQNVLPLLLCICVSLSTKWLCWRTGQGHCSQEAQQAGSGESQDQPNQVVHESQAHGSNQTWRKGPTLLAHHA